MELSRIGGMDPGPILGTVALEYELDAGYPELSESPESYLYCCVGRGG